MVEINKKHLVIAWVIAFLITAQSVYAEKEHPIDKGLTECMDKSKCITSEMITCGEEAYKKWDAELNKYYKLLMSILSSDEKIRLKKSQLAWIKFRDLEFKFIEEGYFQDFGSYIGPTKISNKDDIVRARALELKSYYDTIMAGK